MQEKADNCQLRLKVDYPVSSLSSLSVGRCLSSDQMSLNKNVDILSDC